MSSEPKPGITRSVRELAATAVALAHNRIELATTELELAARFATQRLAWTLGAVGLAVLTLAMLSAFVLVLAWDSHRVVAAAGLTLCYGLGAAGCWAMARRAERRAPALLSGTIGELKRDVGGLRGEP